MVLDESTTESTLSADTDVISLNTEVRTHRLIRGEPSRWPYQLLVSIYLGSDRAA